jgi:hypothetical protein
VEEINANYIFTELELIKVLLGSVILLDLDEFDLLPIVLPYFEVAFLDVVERRQELGCP